MSSAYGANRQIEPAEYAITILPYANWVPADVANQPRTACSKRIHDSQAPIRRIGRRACPHSEKLSLEMHLVP
jgi:hypothetical protein